jgi:hypothetical protein
VILLRLSLAAHADYGADVSVGYGAGALLGSWPDAGPHGFAMARYDAFTVPRTEPGPRLGASLWGARTVWPLQTATEESGTFPFSMGSFGVLAALRFDPDVPWGGLFAFGFGRADLDDYYDGPQALPLLTFEAGARRRSGDRAFIDGIVRASWSTARSPTAPVLHEWWLVEGAVELGVHAH